MQHTYLLLLPAFDPRPHPLLLMHIYTHALAITNHHPLPVILVNHYSCIHVGTTCQEHPPFSS